MPMDGKIQYGKDDSFSQLNYKFNVFPTKNIKTIFLKISTHLKKFTEKQRTGNQRTQHKKERIKLENSHCQISSLTIKLQQLRHWYQRILAQTSMVLLLLTSNPIFLLRVLSLHLVPSNQLATFLHLTLFLPLDHFKCPSFPISMRNATNPHQSTLLHFADTVITVQSSTHFFDHRIASRNANSKVCSQKESRHQLQSFPENTTRGTAWSIMAV